MTSYQFKWLRRFLQYALPVLLATVPALALYGFVTGGVPRIVTETYPYEHPVLIGISQSCSDACDSSRSYLLLPSRQVATVTRHAQGPTVIAKVPDGFIALLASYLLCIAGTWLLWRKPHPPSG